MIKDLETGKCCIALIKNLIHHRYRPGDLEQEEENDERISESLAKMIQYICNELQL